MMSENDENDIIQKDKVHYPHCYYSKALSQSCSYNQNNSNDLDRFVCETVTSISRQCPNERPVTIYSKKDQRTGTHASPEDSDVFGDLGSSKLNDLLKFGFDIDKFLDMHRHAEERHPEDLPRGRTFEFKLGSAPRLGNKDRSDHEEDNAKGGGIFDWFPWSFGNSTSRKWGGDSSATSQNPPKKPQGRIAGPEEDI